MAIIYGRTAAEKDLLSHFHKSVKNVKDIDTLHQKLRDGLSKNEKDFFEKLPSEIKHEEEEIEQIKNDEKKTILKYDEKIKNLESKKSKGGFSSFSASLKIGFIKHYSKRREINKIKDSEKEHQEQLREWKENPNRIFENSQRDTINEIKTIDGIKKSPVNAGARGELNVIDKLSKLSDDYHVLCGLNIDLGKYITYNRRKNLRSAQMDFVVVSRRGVVLVEVKNWSTQYYNSHRNLSPHEQVDRAGRVLWITLKSWRSPSNPRVTSVLLSIQDNMRYDPRYKFVMMSNLNRINYFIENRREEFSDNEVQKIVGRLEDHVTN